MSPARGSTANRGRSSRKRSISACPTTQVGQGAITLHSEERLAASDRGVVMFRRLLRQQIEAVQAGRDPLGVAFDTACATVQVEAGNFILEPAG